MLCWIITKLLILENIRKYLLILDLNWITEWKFMLRNRAWFNCCLKTLMGRQDFFI